MTLSETAPAPSAHGLAGEMHDRTTDEREAREQMHAAKAGRSPAPRGPKEASHVLRMGSRQVAQAAGCGEKILDVLEAVVRRGRRGRGRSGWW
jgi:hypothetical protein